MLPFSRPAVFYLTSSTPSPLTYDQEITPKHSLNIHDLDGKGKEWIIQATVSKISIYNSKNFKLRLKNRIITSTIDIFQSFNIEISIETQLGTLQLDPTLNSVSIHYKDSSLVGKIVLSPGKTPIGFKNLKFKVGEEQAFILADKEGNLFDPQDQSSSEVIGDQEQWVLSYEEEEGGWKLDGLKRGAMNYPVL
ncbi:hypothetical protein JCM3765_002619 [Sporobolomyces pararoseus]